MLSTENNIKEQRRSGESSYKYSRTSSLVPKSHSLQTEADSTGNYALLDIAKALDWVKANIEQFGGDPDTRIIGIPIGKHTELGCASEHKNWYFIICFCVKTISWKNDIIHIQMRKYTHSYSSIAHQRAETFRGKANIEQFGGDPDNITISGFSAGGRDVMAMLIKHHDWKLLGILCAVDIQV